MFSLTLSLFMPFFVADNIQSASSPNNLALRASFLNCCSNSHVYDLLTILPLCPYSSSSNKTESPISTLMRFIRIFPDRYASLVSPFSSSTLKVVFGSASMTVPGTGLILLSSAVIEESSGFLI